MACLNEIHFVWIKKIFFLETIKYPLDPIIKKEFVYHVNQHLNLSLLENWFFGELFGPKTHFKEGTKAEMIKNFQNASSYVFLFMKPRVSI